MRTKGDPGTMELIEVDASGDTTWHRRVILSARRLTSEVVDTLRVHYAVPRGDTTGLLRRVLVPESLWVTDATETHVWGYRWDSMDRPRVVGRRLVPSPPASEGR